MAGTLFSKAVISFDVNTAAALQQLDNFKQRFSSGIGQLKGLIAGFVGFQGLRGAYQGLLDIVDVANKWNIPVEKVSQFANLFTQFGGSADEATTALENFQNMANQLRFHSSGPLKELSAVLRTNLANKDYMGLISALRSQWGGLSDNARAEVQDMLGVDGDAMRRILAADDAEFADALTKAEKLGKITADNAVALHQMRVAAAEAKQALMMAVVPILEALKPLFNVVRDISVWFGTLDPRLRKTIGVLVLGLPVLKTLLGLLGVGGLKGALLGVKGALAGITGLLAGALLIDTVPALISGIRDAIDGSKDLQQILDDMSKKSWVINVAVEWGGKIGEWLGNLIHRGQQNMSVVHFLAGGDADRAHVAGWLERNVDKKDMPMYTAVRDKYNAEMWRMRENLINSGALPRAQSPVPGASDNRVYNLTFNGIQNPNDFIAAFQQVATNNMSPIQGY